MDHANEKVRRVFVERFSRGQTFGHVAKFAGRMIETRGPRSHPGYGAVTFFPHFRFLFSPDQRVLGAGHNGDVGSPDEFEHA